MSDLETPFLDGQALRARILGDVADGYELDARELEILDRACAIADVAVQLQASIAEKGLWITGSTGQERLNPAVAEFRQAQSAVVSLLSKVELGAPEPKTGQLNRRQRNQLRDVLAG